jgi:hypothetical protein
MVEPVFCSRCGGSGVEEDQPTCVVLEGGPCSPCKERAAIQQQIQQLEDEIAKLKAKQKSLGTAMNAVHDPFIHKLPVEIGSHILRLSLPTLTIGEHDPMTIHGPDSVVWAAPLKLGSVCHKWRQLAWATPDLWTTLSIAIDSSMSISTSESLPGLLGDWLGRSGVLPLTIYFFHDSDYLLTSYDPGTGIRTEVFEVSTGLVIDILNSRSGQWRNLHLKAGTHIIERFSSSTGPTQLVGLALARGGNFGRRSLLPREFMMESLTHLKLINLPLTSINVRWDNITHATISEITIDKGLDLLRRAPGLEYYCVSMFESREISVQVPIVHPRLRSLVLSTPYVENFLDVINLPSLEEWTQNSQHLPVTAMLSFLTRSGCRIKVLNLDNNPPPSGYLNNLLQEIPSLERIRLSYLKSSDSKEGIMDDILTRIFHSVPEDRTAGSFLPRLQFIECKMEDSVSPFSWSSIPKFYRHGHRRSLTLRAFAQDTDISHETAIQLVQLADQGVDLQIVDLTMGGDFLENFRDWMHEEGYEESLYHELLSP